ncbi:endocuticle structural glycoprotein SgAbd-2 [Sergentomyia squamirostris]
MHSLRRFRGFRRIQEERRRHVLVVSRLVDQSEGCWLSCSRRILDARGGITGCCTITTEGDTLAHYLQDLYKPFVEFFGLIALMMVAVAAGEYQEQHYHQSQQHYQEPQHHYHQEAQHQHHYEHHQPKKHIPIVKSEDNRHHDGSYNFNYETGNGIHAQEHGYTKNAGHKHETQVAEGYFSYTGDDGIPIGLKYVADEHGFRAEGAHLPTPPPIPHEIQESLAKIAANPHHGHEDYDHGHYRQQQHYQQHEQQEAQYAHQPTYNHHQSSSSGYQHQNQHQQHNYNY